MSRQSPQARILDGHRREQIRQAMAQHGNDAGAELLIDTALEMERRAYEAVWRRDFSVAGPC